VASAECPGGDSEHPCAIPDEAEAAILCELLPAVVWSLLVTPHRKLQNSLVWIIQVVLSFR